LIHFYKRYPSYLAAMPPVFVTCYICGRDFGSRSIGIHVPKCQQKWETEQEKLPKKDRRPLPTAPENFDKVVKGEIKGKDLVKMNQKAFDDYNETALESCQFCERTFLPKALESHRKACTEESPMLKQKGPGYTSQMKAKVNYPKLKSKDEKSAKKTEPVKIEVTKEENKEKALNCGNSGSKENIAKAVSKPVESPVIIRKETVTISSPSAPNILRENKVPVNTNNHSNRSSIIEESRDRSSDEALDEESPLKKLNKKSSLTRGPGTFRKRSTFVKPMSDRTIPTKDDVVSFVENESIFDSLEHRKEILELVTNYTKEVRKKELLELLEHPVFEDTSVLQDAIELLQDFVKNKTNNNYKM